jgi:hypothetical protein
MCFRNKEIQPMSAADDTWPDVPEWVREALAKLPDSEIQWADFFDLSREELDD